MKSFAITKVGYSAGVYGCSGEYFLIIYTKDGELKSMCLNGMYGSEDRVADEFIKLGYKKNYIWNDYSQCKSRDMKSFESEYIIINKIKNNEI